MSRVDAWRALSDAAIAHDVALVAGLRSELVDAQAALAQKDARIAKLEAEIADEMLTWGLACECTCDHCITLQRRLNALLAPPPTPDSPSG